MFPFDVCNGNKKIKKKPTTTTTETVLLRSSFGKEKVYSGLQATRLSLKEVRELELKELEAKLTGDGCSQQHKALVPKEKVFKRSGDVAHTT